MGDFAIKLRAWAWAANPSNAFVMNCDLLETIKERFDAEGIEIPYPYQNTVLQNHPNQSMISSISKTILKRKNSWKKFRKNIQLANKSRLSPELKRNLVMKLMIH